MGVRRIFYTPMQLVNIEGGCNGASMVVMMFVCAQSRTLDAYFREHFGTLSQA